MEQIDRNWTNICKIVTDRQTEMGLTSQEKLKYSPVYWIAISHFVDLFNVFDISKFNQ